MTEEQLSTDNQDQRPIRILSLDGGGIYGMTGALWLRQLCEKDASFLNGEDVDIFVGCSSGACNALLLAMHDQPRKVVLDGLLERFWAEPGTFSNTNPMGALLSFTGQVGWYGEADFRSQLGRYMGNRRLKDLKQKVLISTYDWHGRKSYPDLKEGDGRPRSEPSFDYWAEMWRKAVSGWASGWGGAAYPGPGHEAGRDDDGSDDFPPLFKVDSADTSDRRWKPKFFKKLGDDSEDNDYLIAEIAYGAATPPGFRAMRGGLGDGASFSANPSVHGISEVVDHYRREGLQAWFEGLDETSEMTEELKAIEERFKESEPGDERKKLGACLSRLENDFRTYNETFKDVYREVYEGQGDTYSDEQKKIRREIRRKIAEKHDAGTRAYLWRIRMLSLGDGTRQPYFWQPDSNYGFRSWGSIPANPWRGHWHGPGSYALQASDNESEKISWELLGRRYFRLNPGINDLPTVLAAYYARWPQMRAWILDHIRSAAVDKTSRDAIDKTAKFLQSPNWKGKPRVEPDLDETKTDELAKLRVELEKTREELERCKSQKAES